MKKILLGTTTLIGAATLFAGAAFAETPKVTVGGYANFQVGYMDDDARGTSEAGHTTALGNAAHQRGQAFRNDTQIDFKIDGKNDAGLGYGGEIDILADTSSDVQGRGFNASRTYIYVDGGWGRFEMGSTVGASTTMKVDAATISRATGGINGDWNYFGNASTQFLAQANSPLSYGNIGGQNTAAGSNLNFTGDHTQENINKITYYTPRFNGVQLGLSYLPDQTNRGQGNGTRVSPSPAGPDRANDKLGVSQNIFTGGLSYDNKFGDVGLTLAATGEMGTAQNAAYEDLQAWNVGGKLSYMGWSFAGSYGDWGSSNTLKAANSNSTDYWNLGLAYEYGPFGTSLTYLNSTFDCGTTATTLGATGDCGTAGAGGTGNNNFQSVSAGVDYKLAPGLTPYAEFTYYDQNAAGTANDNKGYVGIVGTQLNF